MRVVAHTWQSFEVRNACVFIEDIRNHLDKISVERRTEPELEFRTWTDREGYAEGSVSLSYRRPATEKEILMDKARQRKSVTDHRS